MSPGGLFGGQSKAAWEEKMKAAIIYWTNSGNTEKVAMAIRDTLESFSGEVTYLKVEDAKELPFEDNQFEILQVKESLKNFHARKLYDSPAVFKFIIRKNNWMALVKFYDTCDCVSGILRPRYILDIDTNRPWIGNNQVWDNASREQIASA